MLRWEPVPLGENGAWLPPGYLDGSARRHVSQCGGRITWKARRDLSDQEPSRTNAGQYRDYRVADFGLARHVHERVQHLSLTQTGLIAGTFEYLPSEAYHASYTPDVRGDIYAPGVILYELLTGSPPRGAWRPVS